MTSKLYILPADDLNINDDRFVRCLSDSRKERISRLNQESAKKLSMGAELCLCAACTELCLPVPPKYKYGENGKPEFTVSPYCFSLCHCDGFSLCAVAQGPVGADAEPQDRTVTPRILSRILSPGEYCPSPIWKWVEKESYVKLTGLGLGQGLGSFSTEGDRVTDSHGTTLAYLTKLELAGLCVCIATYDPVSVTETELLTAEKLRTMLAEF